MAPDPRTVRRTRLMGTAVYFAIFPSPPRQTVRPVCLPSVKLRPRIRLSNHLSPQGFRRLLPRSTEGYFIQVQDLIEIVVRIFLVPLLYLPVLAPQVYPDPLCEVAPQPGEILGAMAEVKVLYPSSYYLVEPVDNKLFREMKARPLCHLFYLRPDAFERLL